MTEQILLASIQAPELNGPDHTGQHLVTARLLLSAGRRPEASSSVAHVLYYLPNLEEAWELNAELQEGAGHEAAASSSYKRAAFLDGYDPLPHEHLAELYLQQKNGKAAAFEILHAWYLQRHRHTHHSLIAGAQYHTIEPLYDDSLPPLWNEYIQPYYDFAGAFNRLSLLYRNEGRQSDSLFYRRLASLSADNVTYEEDGGPQGFQ